MAILYLALLNALPVHLFPIVESVDDNQQLDEIQHHCIQKRLAVHTISPALQQPLIKVSRNMKALPSETKDVFIDIFSRIPAFILSKVFNPMRLKRMAVAAGLTGIAATFDRIIDIQKAKAELLEVKVQNRKMELRRRKLVRDYHRAGIEFGNE